ncbi:MAG: protein-L-isoaspartate(D-aspartate) O-methyltransferase [Gammaproteobacteria bacterium]|nr:protein-L-isoaspartate(D-aspartate) O-methyltransferase [Gammaproteobacteria bacterium]
MNYNLNGIGMTSQRTRDRLIQRLREEGIHDENVLEVMRQTPRHIFVDEALASRSYEDTALPIGHGQTISQPYIVARMTELLLAVEPLKRVLEVGTGSGYQTAILAPFVEQIFTVERISPLLEQAKQRHKALELTNIHYLLSDGSWGWPQYAPFDAIIATAAPEEIPEELKQQLVDGGHLIIPHGSSVQQRLSVIERDGETYNTTDLDMVSFVPLVREKSS